AAARDPAHPGRRHTAGSDRHGGRGPAPGSGTGPSFRELAEDPRVPLVSAGHDFLQALFGAATPDRRDNDDVAVSGQLESGLGVDAQLLQKILVEHECEAVAGPGQLLPHVLLRSYEQYILYERKPAIGPTRTPLPAAGASRGAPSRPRTSRPPPDPAPRRRQPDTRARSGAGRPRTRSRSPRSPARW